MAESQYPIGPTQGGDPLDGGIGGSIVDLFKNRNFLNLLAGIGKVADPNGVGGALGGATIAYNAANAASERADKQQISQDIWQKQLVDYHGGMQPKGVAGVTSMTTTPTGVKLDIDSPPHVQTAEPTLAPTSVAPAAPTTPTTPTAPTAAPTATSTSAVVPTNASGAHVLNSNIRNALPFWSALLA